MAGIEHRLRGCALERSYLFPKAGNKVNVRRKWHYLKNSSLEPLGQTCQKRGIRISSNKGLYSFPMGVNCHIVKMHWQHLKIFSRTKWSITLKIQGQLLLNFAQRISGLKLKTNYTCFFCPYERQSSMLCFIALPVKHMWSHYAGKACHRECYITQTTNI